MNASLSRRPRLALGSLLAAYLLLAGSYGVTIPLWEAPDATWHYLFADHLAAGGGLPSRADEGRSAPWRQQGSQPPLYYLAAAPIIASLHPTDTASALRYNPHANVGVPGVGDNLNRVVHSEAERWPWRGSVLAARLVGLSGLLWGLLTLLATWAFARGTFPERPEIAFVATAFLGLNPQFVFMSTAISNDIAVTAASALSLWALAAVLRLGPRPGRLLILGATLGLASLAKLSGLWLLPLAAGAVAWAVWRDPGAGHRLPAEQGPAPRGRALALLRAGLLVGLPALLLGGWWYLRNGLLFGDPTGLPLMLSVMAPRPAPPGWRELAAEMEGVWKSFWAVFGWFNVLAPGWVYGLVTALTLTGLAGLGLALARRAVPRSAWPGLLLAAAWLALQLAALYLWARLRYPQGRLLFPAAPALALLLAAGWILPWPPGLRPPARRAIALAPALLLGLVTAWLLPGVILPAYRPPAVAGGLAPQEVPGIREVAGGPWTAAGLSLPRFALAPGGAGAALQPGDTLTLTLAWQVVATPDRDWSVFVHLVDGDGVVVAGRDSYPGGGSRPTRDWRPGTTVMDIHRINIPYTAGSPECDPCRILMGLYDANSGERARAADGSEALALGQVVVVAGRDAAGRPRLPEPVRFGDDIALDGYALRRRTVAADKKDHVTLYWRSLGRPAADYRVSVQLRDGDRVLSQSDAAPADDTRPTGSWAPGEVIEDAHAFRVPRDTPPGDYRLWLALFDAAGRRLPVAFRDFEYSLGPVRVTAGPGD